MADTPEQTLAKLRTAKTKLVTGTLPSVFVDQNGEQVRYTKADISVLNNEIRKMEAELEPTTAKKQRPKPVRFKF
ncbi:gpW family head-tail joining protein [uncultured Sulfitobacter sp.]|uniref:gpW family head-tail joining protein n=1 Tax=uncultured Sulfitobacter sp. TaxID=191468 RepID=UPI002592D79B|nr:gpW family head-tail joining protein [uncultured Sulfitobacter sp.]